MIERNALKRTGRFLLPVIILARRGPRLIRVVYLWSYPSPARLLHARSDSYVYQTNRR